MFAEVLHNHLHLLRDIVSCSITHWLSFIFARLLSTSRLYLPTFAATDTPLCSWCSFQHVEDKAFFDRLAHGVDVEGSGLLVFDAGSSGRGRRPKS